MNFLIDYNLTGDAVLFWGTLSAEGWLDLLPVRFFTFQDVGLQIDSSDQVVWQFAQTNQMILVAANRNMKGVDSLKPHLVAPSGFSHFVCLRCRC